MRINSLLLQPYSLLMTNGQTRSGVLVIVTDESEKVGYGDVAPLPDWSTETLDQAVCQLQERRQDLLNIFWDAHTCLKELSLLGFYPSVAFGLESAILSLVAPIAEYSVDCSALFMGSYSDIVEQARMRHAEGFTTAKLKVSQLSFEEAAKAIHELKDKFRLRIDVNRAWETLESLKFFSKFSKDAFDYVEEPFRNPQDLAKFKHPLAVDESYPHDLTLAELEELPMLKCMIYKPTIQGGILGCMPLQKWAVKRGIDVVLSSSFESDIGLSHVASMAYRLSLKSPVGIGTYHFMTKHLAQKTLQFIGGKATHTKG